MVQNLMNMSLTELSGNIAIVLLALSVVVQITPIKLNPWTWIARKVGKAINHDEIEKINRIDSTLTNLRNAVDERDAKRDRETILDFGDDLIFDPDRRHSKDRFDNVVQHITEYNAYCDTHPEFKNNMTEATTKLILTTYEKCMKEHLFL